jgi:hypothetical protein
MFRKLTSFSDVEYGPVGQSGQRDALGRFWSFLGPDEPKVLDLFVETPKALPIPRIGSVYQVTPVGKTPAAVETGLLGHDRKSDRWYRILPFPGVG